MVDKTPTPGAAAETTSPSSKGSKPDEHAKVEDYAVNFEHSIRQSIIDRERRREQQG